MYGLLIMSLWECLFAYYRYYTTLKTTTSLVSATTGLVIKRFSVFALVYFVAFVATIHFKFWLFPCILAFNLLFNIHCHWTFASILIPIYDIIDNPVSFRMMKSVYYIRRLSFICYAIQFGYFSVFMLSQTVEFIHCLPIIWAVHIFVYSFLFVHNRKSFKRLLKCSACQRIKVSSPLISDTLRSKPKSMELHVNTGKLTVPTTNPVMGESKKSTDSDLATLGTSIYHN